MKERPNSFALNGQPIRRLLHFERVTTDDPVAGSGFVGMALKFDADRQEIAIQGVLPGSPAEKGGLQSDDVLLSIAGTPVSDLRGAVDVVRRAKPRSELPIQLRRGEKELQLTVKVAVVPFTVLTGLD